MTDRARIRSRLQPERQVKCGDAWNRGWDGIETTTPIFSGVIHDSNLDALTGERMWDETHPSMHSRNKPLRHYVGGGPYGHWAPIRSDYGGPMWHLQCKSPWLRISGIHFVKREFDPTGLALSYNGGFLPNSMGFFDDPEKPLLGQVWSFNRATNYGDPTVYGAEAWNRFKPKLQAVNLPQILYELKDLPGQLKQTSKGFKDAYSALGGRPGALMAPTAVSEQFLNVQFGWLPFLKDMLDVWHLQHTLKKTMYQNRRNNNRIIRRKGTMFTKSRDINSYGPTNNPEIYPGLSGHLYRDIFYTVNNRWQWGASYHSLSEFDKVTFSAAFKYNIPQLIDDDDSYKYAIGMMRALGIKVSPSTLYKVMPWTWLADWFGNLGDIIDNFESAALDGMCATYAYITRRLIRRQTHRAVVHLYDGRDVECSWFQELDSNRREKANPFGFNLSFGDLSNRQLAILAALGMTRR